MKTKVGEEKGRGHREAGGRGRMKTRCHGSTHA